MSTNEPCPDLAAFLARFTPVTEDLADWGRPVGQLRIYGYLADQEPPTAYTTSVRCVVLRDDQVLVQRDLHSTHILPGGRREANETPEETLRREVREETGWALAGEFLLGFMHLHHLQPAPMGHRYPYPDFLQTVYTAEAVNYAPESRLDDAYELDSTLVSLARVRELELSPHERLYLDAALREQGKQRITTPDLLDAPARD